MILKCMQIIAFLSTITFETALITSNMLALNFTCMGSWECIHYQEQASFVITFCTVSFDNGGDQRGETESGEQAMTP